MTGKLRFGCVVACVTIGVGWGLLDLAHGAAGQRQAAQPDVTVCLKCGRLMASSHCAEGAEVCTVCGLHKGSMGCCRLPKGVKPDRIILCETCGEVLGSCACCKWEGKEKCPTCGRIQGSPGCCQKKPEGQTELAICLKCGEILGSEACCNPKGRKICGTCGMYAGSVGCGRLKHCVMGCQGRPGGEAILCGGCRRMKMYCECPKEEPGTATKAARPARPAAKAKKPAVR